MVGITVGKVVTGSAEGAMLNDNVGTATGAALGGEGEGGADGRAAG